MRRHTTILGPEELLTHRVWIAEASFYRVLARCGGRLGTGSNQGSRPTWDKMDSKLANSCDLSKNATERFICSSPCVSGSLTVDSSPPGP